MGNAFYGIVHKAKELIGITAFISTSYFIVSYFLTGGITFEMMFKVTYLCIIAIFIGLLNGKIKNFNVDIALKDSLTGLYNRQYLFGELENLILENKTRPLIFSILVIYVNDFKIINDTQGHSEGDRILKEIAHMKMPY